MRSPGPTFDVRKALTAELDNAHEALSGELTPEAVHAGRVSLKRLRAIVRIAEAGAPGLAEVFDETARTAGRLLAPAREIAALSLVARKTAKVAKKKAALSLERAATRMEGAGGAIAQIDRAALAAALKDLTALAQVWPDASARQAARGARDIIRRARRARRRALASADPAVRHAWRKGEKARLYAAEAMGKAWTAPRKRALAEKLTDALGRERDAHLLVRRLTTHPLLANDEPANEAALTALRARQKKWRKRADQLGRKMREAGV